MNEELNKMINSFQIKEKEGKEVNKNNNIEKNQNIDLNIYPNMSNYVDIGSNIYVEQIKNISKEEVTKKKSILNSKYISSKNNEFVVAQLYELNNYNENNIYEDRNLFSNSTNIYSNDNNMKKYLIQKCGKKNIKKRMDILNQENNKIKGLVVFLFL